MWLTVTVSDQARPRLHWTFIALPRERGPLRWEPVQHWSSLRMTLVPHRVTLSPFLRLSSVRGEGTRRKPGSPAPASVWGDAQMPSLYRGCWAQELTLGLVGALSGSPEAAPHRSQVQHPYLMLLSAVLLCVHCRGAPRLLCFVPLEFFLP